MPSLERGPRSPWWSLPRPTRSTRSATAAIAVTAAPAINAQPYGILTAKGTDGGITDLTRLVNSVLAHAIADGDWAKLYSTDLHTEPAGAPAPPDHYPVG